MLNGMAPSTPKLSKGELTSIRIQEAAVDLVIQNGIDGTTVEQICQRAEVSERTFFNHFKTKELAIIGDDLPTIDEGKAREFLAAPPGDIFSDALTLIPQPSMSPGLQNLVFKRLQMMRKYPALLAAQMDKLMAVRDEHTELVFLRLRRTYSKNYNDDQLRQMAAQITEIVGSLFRSQIEATLATQAPIAPTKPSGIGEGLRQLVEIGLKA